MNFDKEAKSDKKKFLGKVGGGVGGLPGTETKTVCQTVSNEVSTKMQLSTQCRACGQGSYRREKTKFPDISLTFP